MTFGMFTDAAAFSFCTCWSIAKFFLSRGCPELLLFLGKDSWIGPKDHPEVIG
jgi:hypothetical protein